MTRELEERIEILETRLAYQEDTLRQLDEVLRELFLRLERSEREVVGLREQLARQLVDARDLESERPPHY